MPDLTIVRHEHPDQDLQEAPALAEVVEDRFDTVPQVGDRIYDAHVEEWRVYERGFYPRQGEGIITLTLCPVGCDSAYFRRTTDEKPSA